MAHYGVTCNVCGISDFHGMRHKCTICYDYDLCDNCQLSGAVSDGHVTSHSMDTIDPPEDEYEDDYYDGPQKYDCPYCGVYLTEENLVVHVITNHPDDEPNMVCPICTTRPGGDPNYVSRNLPAHMQLRHTSNMSALNRAAISGTSFFDGGGGYDSAPVFGGGRGRGRGRGRGSLSNLLGHMGKAVKKDRDQREKVPSNSNGKEEKQDDGMLCRRSSSSSDNSNASHGERTRRAQFMQEVVMSMLVEDTDENHEDKRGLHHIWMNQGSVSVDEKEHTGKKELGSDELLNSSQKKSEKKDATKKLLPSKK